MKNDAINNDKLDNYLNSKSKNSIIDIELEIVKYFSLYSINEYGNDIFLSKYTTIFGDEVNLVSIRIKKNLDFKLSDLVCDVLYSTLEVDEPKI